MLRDISRKYFKILDVINSNIYKDKKLIFLYSNMGFRDNVRAMYEYLINNKRFNKYQIVCSLNDYKLYKKDSPKNVKMVNNYIGLLYFFRAKYCFYCFGKYPVKPAKNQKVVNLWHGMPLKRIGNMIEGKENVDYNYFTYILSTSNMFKDILKESFRCDDKQILICGQPRTDWMFEKTCIKKSKSQNKKLDSKFREFAGGKTYNKICIWLPTYRDSQDNSKLPVVDKDILKKIDDIMCKENSLLLIKLHPLAELDIENYAEYENIIIKKQNEVEEKGINLYDLLKNSDALITDYSSVYFDYMLLDRPIAFTVEDIDRYKNDRGFVFDNPVDYMPGNKISNETEMYEFLKSVLDGKDEYQKERREFNKRVNKYNDGYNCERICRAIKLIKSSKK